MKDFTGGIQFDPEIQTLDSRLLEIKRMLPSGLPLDDRLEGSRSPSLEPSKNRNLHVLVEAETQESLDVAAATVEKLLQSVDEVLHEHKRVQISKGTLWS
ncbi:splicing factor-like protein 1 [Durio zibethinus]|uniref:Splicing factor-like protein 1 n=1 Tax=Durio zibethinus TaxID=66656 RepID=A0A6P5XCV9_DURZI|nr:splicing factor-like protein 1 [Durio zibethinus]